MTMKTLLLSVLTFTVVAKDQSHGVLSKGKAKMHSVSDGDALLIHASTMKNKNLGHNMIQPKEGDVPSLNVDVNGPGEDGNVLFNKADTMTQWPTGQNMVHANSMPALNVDVNGPGEDGNVLFNKADTMTQWPTGHNMAQPKDGDVTLSSIEKPSDDGEILWKVKPHMSDVKVYKPAKGKNMIQPKPGETVHAIEGTTMFTNTPDDIISKIESAKAHAKQVKKMKHEHIGKVNKALSDLRADVDNIPHEGKIAG